MRRLTSEIAPLYDGATVLVALQKQLGVSRHAIRRAKYVSDGILLDGERVFTNQHVRAGQQLSMVIDDVALAQATDMLDKQLNAVTPQEGTVDIVYQDDDLLVVNKPAGQVMYPSKGHASDTLGNYVLGALEKQGITCRLHPVHRLDQGTSGLVLFALHGHAQHVLAQALHSGDSTRTYWACVHGVPRNSKGRVTVPIGLVCTQPNVYAATPQGKPATTLYSVEKYTPGGQASIVRLQLETGRTHQIRIHMAHIGHPLFGDTVYGRRDCFSMENDVAFSAYSISPSLELANDRADTGGAHDNALGEGTPAERCGGCQLAPTSRGCVRSALHSHTLDIVHPMTHRHLHFEAPLPRDLRSLVASFDEQF